MIIVRVKNGANKLEIGNLVIILVGIFACGHHNGYNVANSTAIFACKQ